MEGGTAAAQDLAALAQALGVKMKDPALYRQALVHSSYVHERPEEGLVANERLEFLGDAVLQLVVSEYLYNHGENLTEGELSRARASIVSSDALARAGARIGLGALLLLGKGEEASGGRQRPSLLEDAFEAVVGAVYLDGGYRQARRVVRRLLREELAAAAAGRWSKDWKSALQELVQRRNELPVYALVGTTGPDHARVFEVAVSVGGREVGRGRGRSKKEAEMQAAREALQRLQEVQRGRRGES